MVLLYEEITYKVRGVLFDVYNILGFGHKELVYQNALEKEFIKHNIQFERELSLTVYYDDEPVGHYRPDFIIDKKIILETKALEFIPKKLETQVINYLKSTNYQLGLLVNFGSEKLFIKRLILDQRKSVLNP